MYQYQKTKTYLAQVPEDIKELAEEELKSLGAKETKLTYSGIYFEADKGTLYRINYNARLIIRVLAPLISFDCHSDRYLYKTAYNIQWEDFLKENDSFFIMANVSNSKIRHSKFAAQRLKDAIADYFNKKFGKRPSVKKENPDLILNLFIRNNRAVISIDTSRGSLHKRGYRVESVEAPMSEVLAAVIIKLSGWKGETPLYDPFCGSGTILCEAYMMVTDTPAAFLRKRFGFELLPDYDFELWQKIKSDSNERIKEINKGLISGSDISESAVNIAKKNCSLIDKGGKITILKKDFRDIKFEEKKIIMTNPPYGIRLKTETLIENLYKEIGDFFKRELKGSAAFVYFGNRELIKRIGLRPFFKRILYNGGLEGRLVKYDIF